MKDCLEIRVFDAIVNRDIHESVCSGSKKNFTLPCSVQCPKIPPLNELKKSMDQTKENTSKQVSHWILQWFLGASVVSWVGMAVVVSIGDALCFDLLGDDASANLLHYLSSCNFNLNILFVRRHKK